MYKDVESLSVSHACGNLSSSFRLRITRSGCEYDGPVNSYSTSPKGLLPDWFEKSAISGYGEIHSKFDSKVRSAREIPASEFEVEPEFLRQIQWIWGDRFLPRVVRAEPYKIHLYGPGGHFKSHRDTPETSLVGTFLVGLGDTSSNSEGHFCIADKKLRAEPCSWVAFHPDIPHEVTKLEDGHRAVLEFKIFRVADSEPDILPEARVKRILDQIPAPFGLLTTHQYSMDTTSLNGIDALLSAYGRSRNARMFPVVNVFHGSSGDSYSPSKSKSRVYPFTRAHLDVLLERNVVQAKKAIQWFDRLSGIPFYSWDISATSETWNEDYDDDSSSTEENYTYLSYAILFLQ